MRLLSLEISVRRLLSCLFLPSERNGGDQKSLNSQHFFSLVSNVYTLGRRKWEASERLFEKGLNIMEVASITGHEDLKMLKRYTHIKPESLVARLG